METMDTTCWTARLILAVRLITIEPAIFLQSFAFGLQSVISNDLIIAKVCRDLGYNETVCADIDSHTVEDDLVQTQVSSLTMKLSMLQAIPCTILALFVGPWSDRNGRKPVILIPMVGYFFSNSMWILNIYYWEWSANILLSTGIYSFFGGFTSILVGLYSYLADVSSVTTRTTRIGILDIFMFGGVPGGIFASDYVYKYLGYYGIFGTCFLVQVIVFLYIALFIKDTRGPSCTSPENQTLPHIQSTVKRYLSIIDIHQLVDVFRATFRKRNYNLRRVVLLLILLMLLLVSTFSDGNISYLYARKKFKWDEEKYTQYSTCVILVSALPIFILMPLLSLYWKLHDAMIGLLACISKISSLTIIAFAPNGWVMFLGAVTGFLSSMSGIVIRSLLSKCVSKSELGKVYSVLASLEAAVPLVAAPVFTYVYTSTLESFLGSVFLVQSGIFFLSLLVFTYIYFLFTNTGIDFQHIEHSEERLDDTEPILTDGEDGNT